MGENGGNLERTDHTHAGDLGRFGGRDVFAVEQNLSGSGHQEFGKQIETGRLAGAIRTNQGVDMATLDFQIDIADSSESLEFLGQTSCFQDYVWHRVS